MLLFKAPNHSSSKAPNHSSSKAAYDVERWCAFITKSRYVSVLGMESAWFPWLLLLLSALLMWLVSSWIAMEERRGRLSVRVSEEERIRKGLHLDFQFLASLHLSEPLLLWFFFIWFILMEVDWLMRNRSQWVRCGMYDEQWYLTVGRYCVYIISQHTSLSLLHRPLLWLISITNATFNAWRQLEA